MVSDYLGLQNMFTFFTCCRNTSKLSSFQICLGYLHTQVIQRKYSTQFGMININNFNTTLMKAQYHVNVL